MIRFVCPTASKIDPRLVWAPFPTTTLPFAAMIRAMSDREYQTAVCARLDSAESVPFKEVSIGEWKPEIAHCHENVDAWVRAHPECVAVRGWAINASYGENNVELAAHSVVRGPDGKLFDITPFANESQRDSARFVAHVGDDLAFFEIKARGHSFSCPPDSMDNVSVAEWYPSDDDEVNPDSDNFCDLPLYDP